MAQIKVDVFDEKNGGIRIRNPELEREKPPPLR